MFPSTTAAKRIERFGVGKVEARSGNADSGGQYALFFRYAKMLEPRLATGMRLWHVRSAAGLAAGENF
jgi:hypothetical protein